MGRVLFESVGVSAVGARRAFAWPVSAGIHLVAGAAVIAASALAGVELPTPPPSFDVIRLPALAPRARAEAPAPTRGNPLPPRLGATTPPHLVLPDDRNTPPDPEARADALETDPGAESVAPDPGIGYVCPGCRPWGDPNGIEDGPGGGAGGSGGPARPPLRISAGVQPPRKLHDVLPAYPPTAIAIRAEGQVVMDCVIGIDGSVTEVRVVRGHPLLTEAAAAAVRQWRYAPTLLSGEPVAVIMTVTVNFRLAR